MQDIYDVIIVGGGVTGCACAFELTLHGYSCLLLEKNECLLDEASSGNSGMLHTGFDVPDRSVELECIRRCQARVFPLADQLGVPVHTIGATMVAWNTKQVQAFPGIIEKSDTAGCSSIRQLSVSELRQREPHLSTKAQGALHVPGEAVTDPWLLPTLLVNDARRKGATVLTGAIVTSLNFENTWTVETARGIFRSKSVVNCAGLYGDVVSMLAGKQEFRILPRKGQYSVYHRAASGLLHSSIVPVPTDAGKGVIVFRSVYDNVIVGPTAENVDSKRKPDIDEAVVARLAGVAENVIPKLTSYPVVNMYTGVRPATELKDYIIRTDESKNLVTVGGIRSTGLSGCLGIAELVKQAIEEKLKIEPSRGRMRQTHRAEVTFTRRRTAVIDGIETRITHPLTYMGLLDQGTAKL